MYLLYSSLDYFLSHKALNEIIAYSYDFSKEELVMEYVSLLKTLAVRLNTTTIAFFFNAVCVEL